MIAQSSGIRWCMLGAFCQSKILAEAIRAACKLAEADDVRDQVLAGPLEAKRLTSARQLFVFVCRKIEVPEQVLADLMGTNTTSVKLRYHAAVRRFPLPCLKQLECGVRETLVKKKYI